jgi:hypothetical protein
MRKRVISFYIWQCHLILLQQDRASRYKETVDEGKEERPAEKRTGTG